MSSCVCQWKTLLDPCWRIVQKKLTWRNGHLQEMIFPTNKDLRISLRSYRALATKVTHVMKHLQYPDQRGSVILFPGKDLSPQDKAYFWERNEAPLPPLQPRCNYIHPRKLSPFPERLKLPFSSDEILSGFEEIVSSGTDQFTAWVKTDPHDTLVHHMVDVQKAIADFREASERRRDASSHKTRFSKNLSNCFPVYLQLEPRAPTRKRRCFRKTDCRQVARHHIAGSD